MDLRPKIHILQCNTDKSKHTFHELIQYFTHSKHNIALVTEPYIGAGDKVKNINGLNLFQFPSPNRKVKSCIITKSGIGPILGISEHSSPNLCIVRAQLGHTQIHIISIYIEPRTDTHNTLELTDRFLQHNTQIDCVLGGDLNGWHPSWGSARANARGADIVTMAHANDLYVCNTGSTPTFETTSYRRYRSSIIDITLASASLHQNITHWKVNMDACPSSEHNAIDFTITHNQSHSSTHTTQHSNTSTFLYKNHKAHWPTFNSALLTHALANNLLDTQIDTLNNDDLELFIDKLTDTIHSACKESMPIRTPGSKPKPPWWTEALETRKREVISLHRALHVAKRNGGPTESLGSQLLELKATYANELRAESTTSFRRFCELQTKENVWTLTNRLIKESSPRIPPATLKTDDNTYTTDGHDTAKALLDRFYPDDDPDIEPRHSFLRSTLSTPSSTEPDPPFTTQEVLEVLKDMSPKKAPGLDNLTADICFKSSLLLPGLITDVMNRCLALHHFPRQWKRAYVKIIPKPNKSDHTDLNSYRPIGLLPVFGKALEKLFVRRVTYTAAKAGKLNDRQYGFKPQTNTTAALRAAIDQIKTDKNNGLMTVAVSLDIKAAFDNAWWPALFHRLRHIDCPSNIYRLILSYTTDRTVILDHAGSRISKTMSKGCIQGSACGPVLWNIILDELLELDLPSGCRLQAFADDVLLVASARDLTTLQNNTEHALNAIVSWGRGVKLTFSPNKTQAIAFSGKAKRARIHIDSHPLHMQDSIKLLGVILDEKLLFQKHLTHIITKATLIFQKLILYCRPTWGAHPENIRTIYNQVIQPIITYAAGIWGHVVRKKCAAKKLLGLQRGFAIRAIRGFRTISTVAAIALARFTPIDLKVLEVREIETTRLDGTSSFLPDDIALEKQTPPHNLLHPADRVTLAPHYFHNESQIAEFLSSHPHPIFSIYTDGSKLDDGSVGAAFICYDERGRSVIKKFKLHCSCSVFQAELLAILEAAKWASLHKHPHTLILSDSKAAIQAAQYRSNTHPLVSLIHHTLHTHSHTGRIELAWVKSHVGIAGNEAADTAAKSAALLHKASDYSSFPISYTKRMAREMTLLAWRKRYEEAQEGQHTRNLLPTLDHIYTLFKNTHISFTLTQTLSGHSYSKSYLYKFHITESDACPCDDQTSQTIDHLLRQCPRFTAARFNHTQVCRHLDIDPFNFVDILKHQSCVDSFVRLSSSVINALKEYNST